MCHNDMKSNIICSRASLIMNTNRFVRPVIPDFLAFNQTCKVNSAKKLDEMTLKDITHINRLVYTLKTLGSIK
jgi:hypothetical protein